jgi:vacuolar-type H+-ATPase subunit H
MTNWVPVFIVVTALAVVLQAAVMTAMYFLARRTTERVERTVSNMEARVEPILTRVQYLIEDAQPRISSAIADAAEITHLARSQAQKVDRVFTETLDRARMQLAHADQILTGALEAVEDAGSQIRRTVVGPINSASAVIRGIQTGLEFFRSRRRRPHSEAAGASGDHPDENLFI